ncbi:MAG: ABC transporter ATP-binding protein [Oscillospiraceae bacterium]
MGKILKYLKKYWLWAVTAICLLVVQAYCDMSLPTYTSKIVDTGIMQKGVENITPQAISPQTMQGLMLFMNEDEKKLVEDSYEIVDGVKNTKLPYTDIAVGEEVYSLKGEPDDEQLQSLDDAFGMSVLTFSGVMQMSDDDLVAMLSGGQAAQGTTPAELAESMGITVSPNQPVNMMTFISAGKVDPMEMRRSAEEKYADNSDMMTEQAGKAFVINEYTALGVDLDRLEKNYLFATGGKMLAMALVIMLVSIAVCYISAKVGAGIGLDLRIGVFKKVIRFSNAEMDKFSTASLITRSTNDIQQIQMVAVMLIRMVAYAPIVGIGGIIKVLNTNTSMTWIIGLAVGVILLVVLLLMSIAMPKFKVMQKKVDNLNLVMREILTGLPVIRAFSREKYEEDRFDGVNKDLTKTMLFTNRVMTFMMPAMMFIMNGISVLIIWVASKEIDMGNLQVGSMTAFLTYTMQIVMAFLMITMVSVMLPRAAVSADRIDEILNTEPVINDKAQADEKLEVKSGLVEFDHVNFRYPNADADVLHDIHFTAKPGETTAIIGSTGSGKSTLINLIPRFYDVTEGEIKIDGVDVRDYTQYNLRESIGFVPQKGVLFSGDIDSNLRFGCADAPAEQVELAAEIAQATEFIDSKPDRYKTHIAQGGSNVSGGQKQRLSIARAIAKAPKILIFDDSFSALDYKTDVKLRKALSKNVSDKTIIIVAQRIVTIMNADKIIALDEGRIAGIGTHYELLRSCEVYKQIVKSQLSEKEYEQQISEAELAAKEEM